MKMKIRREKEEVYRTEARQWNRKAGRPRAGPRDEGGEGMGTPAAAAPPV